MVKTGIATLRKKERGLGWHFERAINTFIVELEFSIIYHFITKISLIMLARSVLRIAKSSAKVVGK